MNHFVMGLESFMQVPDTTEILRDFGTVHQKPHSAIIQQWFAGSNFLTSTQCFCSHPFKENRIYLDGFGRSSAEPDVKCDGSGRDDCPGSALLPLGRTDLVKSEERL
jgi:hypothetical protein